MSNNSVEWVEVIPLTRLGEGEGAFAEWLAANRLSKDAIQPDDIRVQVIRVKDGSRMRYLVRRSVLRQLGITPGAQEGLSGPA